jgi:Lon protease-like protein
MDEFRLNTLPTELPVMVLSDFVLFPHGVEALYIFEAHYRQMLKHVLEGDRVMGVVVRKNIPELLAEDKEHPDLFPTITTLGLVRACVMLEDGTGYLMLQGLERVRITGWAQTVPYRVANIEPFTTTRKGQTPAQLKRKTDTLVQRILTFLDTIPEAAGVKQTILQHMEDPEMLADFIASNFLEAATDRELILEMGGLRDRLDFLLEKFPVA